MEEITATVHCYLRHFSDTNETYFMMDIGGSTLYLTNVRYTKFGRFRRFTGLKFTKLSFGNVTFIKGPHHIYVHGAALNKVFRVAVTDELITTMTAVFCQLAHDRNAGYI